MITTPADALRFLLRRYQADAGPCHTRHREAFEQCYDLLNRLTRADAVAVSERAGVTPYVFPDLVSPEDEIEERRRRA